LGIWNVRSLYRSGSVRAVAREVEWYKLDIVGDRWLGGQVGCIKDRDFILLGKYI
jgi:hypothetical protein